jgi:hypothetical protein
MSTVFTRKSKKAPVLQDGDELFELLLKLEVQNHGYTASIGVGIFHWEWF